jgi:cystathionine beta-lyase
VCTEESRGIHGDDADAQVWSRVGPWIEHGASNMGVIASTAAYRDGGDWLNDVIAYNDRNRFALQDLVAEQLPTVR